MSFQEYGDHPLPDEEVNCDAEDSTMSTSTIADVQEMPQTEPKQPPITSRPGSNKRKKTNDDLTSEVLTTMRDHFKRPTEQHDRYDLIGRTIALRLKSLDKRVALVAEKKINDILFEAEMGYLSTPTMYPYASSRSQSPISTPCPTPSPSPTYEQCSVTDTLDRSGTALLSQDNTASYYFSQFNPNV